MLAFPTPADATSFSPYVLPHSSNVDTICLRFSLFRKNARLLGECCSYSNFILVLATYVGAFGKRGALPRSSPRMYEPNTQKSLHLRFFRSMVSLKSCVNSC